MLESGEAVLGIEIENSAGHCHLVSYYPVAGTAGLVGLGTAVTDVTHLKDVERRLEETNRQLTVLATTDALTQLPNRRLLDEQLELALARARRGGLGFAILNVDVDRFKEVNDTLGHAYGDRRSKAVAGCLRAGARETDVVARVGGDEFVILLADLDVQQAPQLAQTVVDRIAKTLSEPLAIDPVELRVERVDRRRDLPDGLTRCRGTPRDRRRGDVHRQGCARPGPPEERLPSRACPRATLCTAPRSGCSRSSGSGSRWSRRIPVRQATGVAQRIDGRVLESVEAVGKNLLLRFEGGIVVRSHLRMTGRWRVEPRGKARVGLPWLVLRGDELEGVLWNGPVLSLEARNVQPARPGRARRGRSISTRSSRGCAALRDLWLGEALQDQRLVAGIGNMWMAEALWDIGVSPWLRVGETGDEVLRDAVAAARRLMQAGLETGRPGRQVYRRAGRPCLRCGTIVRSRGQGDANRTVYWCPTCQAGGSPPGE